MIPPAARSLDHSRGSLIAGGKEKIKCELAQKKDGGEKERGLEGGGGKVGGRARWRRTEEERERQGNKEGRGRHRLTDGGEREEIKI